MLALLATEIEAITVEVQTRKVRDSLITPVDLFAFCLSFKRLVRDGEKEEGEDGEKRARAARSGDRGDQRRSTNAEGG